MTHAEAIEDALRKAVELAATRRQLPTPSECVSIRLKAGLTREQLAAAVGVTDSALALWEKGARRPSDRHAERYLSVLREIARASGADVEP
jgi:DNA-binding transcriptional regulator YiaG